MGEQTCAVVLMLCLVFGCARTQTVVPAYVPLAATVVCGDKAAALRVARDVAAQTEQSDGVKVRIDERRAIDQPDRWKVWALVGEGRPCFVGEEAYLIVRKRDCGTDWELMLCEE
jgi:hypothetical protein